MSLDDPRTMRMVAPIVVWVCLAIGCVVMLGPGVWTYLHGENAVAHVDRCETTRHMDSNGHSVESTTCYGSWTVGGARHSGKVDGATGRDYGHDVAVRAYGDHAAVRDTPRRTLFIVAVIALACGVVHVSWWAYYTRKIGRTRSRRERARGHR